MNEQEKHHNLNDLLDIMRGALAALGGFLIRFGGRVTFLFFAGNFYRNYWNGCFLPLHK